MINSSQIESSESNSQDRLDFERFQGIWNNIKRAKQSSAQQSNRFDKESSNKKSIVSVKKAIQQEQQKNIETRLILTQKQLKKSKQNTNLLLKKLSQAEQQIQYFQYELQKQINEKRQLELQIEQLRKYQIKNQKSNEYEKLTIRDNQSELDKVNKLLQMRQRQVDKLNLKVKSLELTLKNQENQIKLLNQNAQIAQKKLQQASTKSFLYQQDYLAANMKGTQILQLQQAYTTIERLMILLRNTEQYNNFSLLIEDFKDSHFLKNIQNRIRKNDLLQKPSLNKRACSCMEIKIDQKLLWTPNLCYKKVLQLKLKYDNLNEECIEQLLFQLNKIYVSKQQRNLRCQKQFYQNELAKLRKKNEIRYDELVARKQIQRLKKQIQKQKYSKNTMKDKTENDNIEMYKAIGQYEDQLRLKQRQIMLLKERIRLMENQNNSYDKILYLEGTLWILDKILLELEANSQDLQMFESKFRERITNKQIMSDEQWINNFKYFFQNITQIQNGLLEKLLMMKQSTVTKMGNMRDSARDDNSFGRNQ